jgi:hypothetical protein
MSTVNAMTVKPTTASQHDTAHQRSNTRDHTPPNDACRAVRPWSEVIR